MQVKEQVTVRLSGGVAKTIHDVGHASRIGLLRQIADAHRISRVLENYDVVRVERNGASVLAGREEVLRQIDASDVVVVRAASEQVQHPLVLPTVAHEVVQNEQTGTTGGREQGADVFGHTVVELHSLLLHGFEAGLGFAVAIDGGHGRPVKNTARALKQAADKRGLSALTGSGHDDAAGGLEPRFVVRHGANNDTPGVTRVFKVPKTTGAASPAWFCSTDRRRRAGSDGVNQRPG